jgi:hypothetical protein
MFLGALLGGCLALDSRLVPVLAMTLVLLSVVSAVAQRYRTVDAPWVRTKP